MIRNFFSQKNISRGIFMIAGLFVFFSATSVYALNCGIDTVSRDSITYGTVVAEDGNCWLDRNLGASGVATAYNDTQSYGWIFQWGRGVDGHQTPTSGTTITKSSSDVPGHGSFIKTTAPYDWRSPHNENLWQGIDGINNPCPSGFRVPTRDEWDEIVSLTNMTNNVTAFSNSSLKIPSAGFRDKETAVVGQQGNWGLYWTSSGNGAGLSFYMGFYSSGSASASLYERGSGFSVRCIEGVVALQDITIPDPNTTKMQDAVTDEYINITGDINNAQDATTQVNITFTSTSAQALFPTNTIITEQNSGNYNLANFTIGDTTIQNSIAAIELGIPGTNLSFSQDITVTLNVGTEYNDQTLQIYSQSVGQTDWTTHGTCTISEGNCTFTTDHATTYTVGGNPAAETININVEVQDTLSLDCYESGQASGDHTVTLSDSVTGTGYVVAGIPSVGQSTCDVTTNDDQGYFLTIDRSTEDVTWAGTNGSGLHAATNVLIHEDPNTDGTWYEIPDTGNGLSTYNGSNSAIWTEGTTKGLGFSVITFPDSNTANNTLDDDWELTGTQCLDGSNTGTDTAKYAAVPEDPQPIAAVTQYEANQTSTTVCYKVDVLASQQSGQYAGQVTYTATSDASGYLN